MYCTECGNTVEEHARFCSKCGSEMPAVSAAPAQPRKQEHNMEMHVNILGWLLIGSGVLTAIGGMIVLFVGKILPRAPIPFPPEMPPGIPPFASWLLTVIGLAVLAMAAATAGAGVGLLQYRSWARTYAIIMAVLMLFNFPIGTAVAIYAFWVLFSEEGTRFYNARTESTMSPGGL